MTPVHGTHGVRSHPPALSDIGPIWDYTGHMSTETRRGGSRPNPARPYIYTGSMSTVPGVVAPHPALVPCWHYMCLHRTAVYGTQGRGMHQ